ncbi:PLP-dependent aminotransferase family protein [Bacillus hominis]|uniref:PLP-dependent aminotransferase family protein n=1 Tax=Bacillus hominis TaxID=2817478 RepID=A0ABT7RH52_9BACI|nr:PLP-dependent aminotransferase family protein [Bacillus hominis]MDM5191442.1 PLP-dependent aminotransferase family protein [Bacillus hominis]MDM5441869.1 PLP-dependent aminotransferase family protein [Bacillus hominis]
MKELIFNIDQSGNVPMYQQIYVYIRIQILSGKITYDTKLPSIRQLAELLNVSRNTTQVAYEQLLAEGYIRSENKKGYFVQANMSNQVLTYEPTVVTPRGRQKDIRKTIDFKIGTVDRENFPIAKWRSLTNKVLMDPIMYSYGEKQGDMLLRTAISDYLFQSRGVSAVNKQILIGSSTQHLLLILTLLLKEEFHRIAVEDPGYNGARELFSLQSFSVEPISVIENGLDVDQLCTTDTRLVYVTPTHHFPYGLTMPVSERLQLINWAEQVNGYIIEDDYDSEFRYIHQPVPSLHSIDSNDRTVYLSTFSKALLPSIRVSYMVLPKRLLPTYEKIGPLLEQTASSVHQRTLAHFISEGYWYAHLRKMKTLYKRKIKVLCEEINKHFKNNIKIKGYYSGIYVVIEVKTQMSEKDLINKAFSNGVTVYPCSQYFVKNAPKYPHIQLGLGNLSEHEITEGICKLANIWLEKN